MDYLEYSFSTQEVHQNQEVFIALLNEVGYEGFLESDDSLKVYLPENLKNENLLNEIIRQIGGGISHINYSCKLISEKNWNEQWESDFQAIEIDKDVKIRASFHPYDPEFRYDLLIDPKMSFGTGHHETTRLMIQTMLMQDFTALNVLDMGCGTGVLGILASKMGAETVCAIDIDDWSYKNSVENIKNNSCSNIEVRCGDIQEANTGPYDLILANINRNVLLADMSAYYKLLKERGILILSGIMEHDLEVVLDSTLENGFEKSVISSENKWFSIILYKV